jgi:hypothetical protein
MVLGSSHAMTSRVQKVLKLIIHDLKLNVIIQKPCRTYSYSSHELVIDLTS